MKKIGKTIGFIILYLAVYYLAQTIMSFVMALVYGIKYGYEAAQSGVQPDMAETSKLVTEQVTKQMPLILLVSVAIALGAYWLIARIRKARMRDSFQAGKLSFKWIGTAIVLGLTLDILISFLLSGLSQSSLLEKTFEQYSELTSAITAGNFVWTFIAVGIAVPIFEELLFRGLVYHELRKVAGVWTAIIIQAVLFGLYHMNIVQGAYAVLIGLALGYVYHKSRSIIAPILLHISVNCASVLFTQDQVSSALNEQPIVVLSASVILFAMAMVVIVRHKRTADADGNSPTITAN